MSLRVWLPLNGTLENKGLDDVVVTNNGATVDNNGKIGKCYNFNGSSYLSVPIDFSNFSTTECSMCVWAKLPEPSSGNKQLIHIGKGSGWTNNRFVIIYRTGYAQIITSISDGTNYVAYNCSTSIETNTWIHIAAIYKDKTLKLYINGDLKKSYTTTYDISFNSISSFGIGAAPNGAEKLTGYLNDVRIYDHALSPLEVKHISQGLILHYPLNRNGWGQENLLLNTQVLTPNSSTTTKNCSQRGSAVRQLRTDGFYEAKCTSAWQGLSTWANAQNLIVGQKYTYSFYFYTDGSIKSLSFYPMMFNSSGTRDTSSTLLISVDGSGYQNVNSRTFGNFSNSTPIKHYITFEWNNAMASIISNGGTIELSIQVHGTFNSGEYGCVYAPKLEIGDKMTSWCPNSSDALATTMGLNDNVEYDVSGYCNNGTRTGTFSWTGDTPRYNVSTSFNGSAKIGRDSLMGEVYTLSCWAKTTKNKSTSQMIVVDSNSQMAIAFYNGTIIGVYGTTRSTGSKCTLSDSNYKENEWNHFVVVKTSSDGKRNIYCNGELLTPSSDDYWSSTPNNFAIGARNTSTPYYFYGEISDVRVYATALSAEDVKDLYELGATIDTNGVLSTYEFTEQ